MCMYFCMFNFHTSQAIQIILTMKYSQFTVDCYTGNKSVPNEALLIPVMQGNILYQECVMQFKVSQKPN